MKDTKQLPGASLPTGITPRSVNLSTKISNDVVRHAEDPKLRGPVYLDCLMRSHADWSGYVRITQEQLAEEAGVSDRTIREWSKVCEDKFGWKILKHAWSPESGRNVHEYWLPYPDTGWSLVPTSMLRLPGVPYQSKLLLCSMGRVSEGARGSRMPKTLAKLMGYSNAKDVWKWIQPVRGLIEMWREGDSKKLFWSLPGGLDMDMDRVADPTGGAPQVTWMSLQDQAPLLPVAPPDTGTATSGIEDPLHKPKTMEDASSDACQTSQLLDEEGSPVAEESLTDAATGEDMDGIRGMEPHWGKQNVRVVMEQPRTEEKKARGLSLAERCIKNAGKKQEEAIRLLQEDMAENVVRLRDYA